MIEYRTYNDKEYLVFGDTWFDKDTDLAIATILDYYMHKDVRLRFWYGYTTAEHRQYMIENYPGDHTFPAVGMAWDEDWQVSGTVGRTAGPVKSPILLAGPNSHCGGLISTDSIVKIVRRRTGKIQTLYQHPQFSCSVFIPGNWDGKYAAFKQGERDMFASFGSIRARNQWVDFMNGERLTQ